MWMNRPIIFCQCFFCSFQRVREKVMEGGGDGSGEVKVDVKVEAECEGGREEDPSEETVMKNVENGAADTVDTEKEDVKLQIEDDPELSRDEEEKEAKEESVGEEEKEEELKEVSVKEDKDKDKAENLDYQGLVDQLRLEFGKGQQISLASFLFTVLDHKLVIHFYLSFYKIFFVPSKVGGCCIYNVF